MAGTRLAVLSLTVLLPLGSAHRVAAQVPIGQLILKGTHNSYQCHGDTPNMGHWVNTQIDDFGVWGLELDVGFVDEGGGRIVAVIGHDRAGGGTCINIPEIYPLLDPHALEGYLRLIKASRAFTYRPIVLFFDWKLSDRDGWSTIGCPNNDCDGFAKAAAEAVFDSGNVLRTAEAIGKSVPELAGKVILGMNQNYSGDCTNKQTVEGWFTGNPNINFFRIDQYQGDWTFDIGAPPNPLIVDWSTNPPISVTDSIGDSWICITEFFPPNPNCWTPNFTATCDLSNGEVVHEQGTYRFPFRTLGSAVARAQGMTSGNPSLLSRRTGIGWTVLIKSGNYPETLTISTPLTLKALDASAGLVVIGRR